MDVYGFTVKHSADSPVQHRRSIASGRCVAASANSCIDFQSALDLSFSVHDTRAAQLKKRKKKGGVTKRFKPSELLL